MPSIPELPDTLTDGVVSLRLYAERDIPEILIAYQDDPRLHEQLGQLRPPSGAELGSQAERSAGDRAAGQRVSLTVLAPGSTDTCVGQVRFDEFDWDNARARVRVWVAPAARRRGVASAALRLASRWVFQWCRLGRIDALVDPGNEAALHTLAAAGFAREGLLRAYERARPGRQDRVSMSLLPADLG